MLAFFARVSCPTRPEHFIIIGIVLRDKGPDSEHQYGFLESMTASVAPVVPRLSWDPGKTRDALNLPTGGREAMSLEGESLDDIPVTIPPNTTDNTTTAKNRHSCLHLPSVLKLPISCFSQLPAPSSLPPPSPSHWAPALPFNHMLDAKCGPDMPERDVKTWKLAIRVRFLPWSWQRRLSLASLCDA